MHRLISDGGTITVGRRTANYTWGMFEVELQEGLQQAEKADSRMADGYIYRPDDRGTGRAELTFVRADAHLNLNAAKSDLETTMDSASKRTSGDAYYTRELSGPSLGRTRPGEDYVVGDQVEVLLWGKTLVLPVTGISRSASESDLRTVRVQVGNQMLRDAEALSKRNDAIYTQIAAEKRQRLKDVGVVSRAASRAQSTADSARGEVQAVRDTLAGEQAQEPDLLAQLVAVNDELQRLGQDPQPSLMLAFVQLSTALWETQQKWNRERETIDSRQDAFDADLQEQLRTMEAIREEAERRRPRPVFARFSEYKGGYTDPDGLVRIREYAEGERGFHITCLGTWTGTMVVRATARNIVGSHAVDSVRVEVTASSRIFHGRPGAVDMWYEVMDLTVFPD